MPNTGGEFRNEQTGICSLKNKPSHGCKPPLIVPRPSRDAQSAAHRGMVRRRNRVGLVALRLSDEAELVRSTGLRLLIAKFAAGSAGCAVCPIEEKGKQESHTAEQVLTRP